MGSTSFLRFFCPNLLLFLRNLLFLGTCYIFFLKCWDFLWVFLSFYVPYYLIILGYEYLVTTEIRFFVLKSRSQNGF